MKIVLLLLTNHDVDLCIQLKFLFYIEIESINKYFVIVSLKENIFSISCFHFIKLINQKKNVTLSLMKTMHKLYNKNVIIDQFLTLNILKPKQSFINVILLIFLNLLFIKYCASNFIPSCSLM